MVKFNHQPLLNGLPHGHNPNCAHFHSCKRRNCKMGDSPPTSLAQKSVISPLVRYSGTTAIKAINIYTHKALLKQEALQR